MKTRRHHNNTGLPSTKRGRRIIEVQRIARRLGIPYGESYDDEKKRREKELNDYIAAFLEED